MSRDNTYDTVARAIRYVRDNVDRQPSLEDVARHVGLSEFHLQRVFSAWAGVSPKRYLQVLTAERAKALLRSSSDVLGAALDVGLSSPSRLHDLTVACDAMTPGEIARGGEGLTVRVGSADSPYGRVVVGRTERGVCHLQFSDHDDALAQLGPDWPRATIVRDDDAARATVRAMFGDGGDRAPVPVLLRGTNFQVQVWRAVVRIPPGSVASYTTIARAIGAPGSSRAVGSAVGKNAVALLIPCHRVIREDGGLGGYRWGLERKDTILAREALMSASP